MEQLENIETHASQKPPSSAILVLLALACGSATATMIVAWMVCGLPSTYLLAILIPGFVFAMLLRSSFRIAHLRDVRSGFLTAIWASVVMFMLLDFALHFEVVFKAYHALPFIKRYDMDKFFPYVFCIMPFLAWKLSKSQITAAYCETCGNWTAKPQNIAFVPNDYRDALITAVQSQDVDDAIELTRATEDLPLGQGSLTARVSRCPVCGCQKVDVLQNASTSPKIMPDIILRPVLSSDEFVMALRSGTTESDGTMKA